VKSLFLIFLPVWLAGIYSKLYGKNAVLNWQWKASDSGTWLEQVVIWMHCMMKISKTIAVCIVLKELMWTEIPVIFLSFLFPGQKL